MKKLYTLLFSFFLLLFFKTSFSQVLTFSFEGSNGDEATWPSSAQGAGVEPSTISRGSGVTQIANADRFNSRGWTLNASIDLNDYLEFTVTPVPGYVVTITDIVLQHQRSSTGPVSFVIRTSQDAFAADATNVVTIGDVNTNQSSSFVFTTPIQTSSAVTIRIYAYSAESVNGTWGPGESASGNDLVVSGTFVLLPVNFSNVRAVDKNNRIEISWTSLAERDVLHYEVERSPDGQRFTVINRQDPIKNDGEDARYSYPDIQPYSGVNYYRIKGTETSGKVYYSNTLKMERGSGATGLTVYPNPAPGGSQVTLQMKSLPQGIYTLSVYNAMGQVVQRRQLNPTGGSFTQTFLLGNWQRGIYILEMTGPVRLQKQLVVQ